jgi:hypothetical protein
MMTQLVELLAELCRHWHHKRSVGVSVCILGLPAAVVLPCTCHGWLHCCRYYYNVWKNLAGEVPQAYAAALKVAGDSSVMELFR